MISVDRTVVVDRPCHELYLAVLLGLREWLAGAPVASLPPPFDGGQADFSATALHLELLDADEDRRLAWQCVGGFPHAAVLRFDPLGASRTSLRLWLTADHVPAPCCVGWHDSQAAGLTGGSAAGSWAQTMPSAGGLH